MFSIIDLLGSEYFRYTTISRKQLRSPADCTWIESIYIEPEGFRSKFASCFTFEQPCSCTPPLAYGREP